MLNNNKLKYYSDGYFKLHNKYILKVNNYIGIRKSGFFFYFFLITFILPSIYVPNNSPCDLSFLTLYNLSSIK